MSFEVREAKQNELDEIYLLGQDAWGQNLATNEYLEICRSSPKYKKGNWFILKNKTEIVGALIIYDFKNEIFGIGSIATKPSVRKKGLASYLIQETLGILEMKKAKSIYLYADVNPKFYEKFGFVEAKEQRHLPSVCMFKGVTQNTVPAYF